MSCFVDVTTDVDQVLVDWFGKFRNGEIPIFKAEVKTLPGIVDFGDGLDMPAPTLALLVNEAKLQKKFLDIHYKNRSMPMDRYSSIDLQKRMSEQSTASTILTWLKSRGLLD